MTPKVVQMLARYADISTTMRVYGQLGYSEAIEGIAALDRAARRAGREAPKPPP
ncbi:MAG: hypothetical protein KF757_08960 [Phycisphaeraceae bacterium]|nr:hypothetical protein [Phycisphaeraceae bacterium]MCW5762883.1 hypothetical protein [Phycisphaeraceae bacterium]